MLRSCALGLGLLLLFGTGCSRVRIAYDWADTVIVASVDRYFDLTSEQKKIIKPRVREDLRTILEKDIPFALSYLEEFVQITEKKSITRDEIFAFEKKGEEMILTALKRMEPNVHKFFEMINPSQIAFYKKKIQKQMDEHDEKFKSQERQRAEIEKRIEFQFEFVGLELNRDQQKLLDDFLDQGNFPLILEKKSRRTNINLFLEAALSSEKIKAFIGEVFQNPRKFRSEEYSKALESYRSRLVDLKIRILASLSPDQKTEIRETITKLVRQLEDLRVHQGFTAR